MASFIRITGGNVLHHRGLNTSPWHFVHHRPLHSLETIGANKLTAFYKTRVSEICLALQAKDLTALWPMWQGWSISLGPWRSLNQRVSPSAVQQKCRLPGPTSRDSNFYSQAQGPGKLLESKTPQVLLRAITTLTRIIPSSLSWPWPTEQWSNNIPTGSPSWQKFGSPSPIRYGRKFTVELQARHHLPCSSAQLQVFVF